MIENCVAIDGYSSSGKSSVSQILAKRLKNYYHLNTGSLYRAIAYCCKNNNVDPNSERSVLDACLKNKIYVKFDLDKQLTFVNDENVEPFIRTEEISELSSFVSRHQKVREFVVELQRQIATEYDLVMEGRDITSVVLPNSKFKFFITANLEVRAKRRYNEIINAGNIANYEEIFNALKDRDKRDVEREFGALVITKDSIVVDTSNMTINEVVDFIIQKINSKK